MNRRRGNVLLVILLFLAVTAGIGFLVWKNPRLITQRSASSLVNSATTPTIAPVPTSDWKTYRNKKYEFEFKYPAEVNVCDFQNNIGFEYGFRSLCQDSEDRDKSLLTQAQLDNVIKDFKNRLSNSFSEVELPIENDEDGSKINSFNEIKSNDNSKALTWFKLTKGYIYITISGENKNASFLFDQILSTFKFINQEKDIAQNVKLTVNSMSSKYGDVITLIIYSSKSSSIPTSLEILENNQKLAGPYVLTKANTTDFCPPENIDTQEFFNTKGINLNTLPIDTWEKISNKYVSYKIYYSSGGSKVIQSTNECAMSID